LETASYYCIPLSLSLKTPVIEDAVDSICSIANCIAYIAYTLTVSSYPLNIVFNVEGEDPSLPSYEESIGAIPDFLYAINFYNFSAVSCPKKLGSIDTSTKSPTVPLLAIRLSL